jgi:hypothetical protein
VEAPASTQTPSSADTDTNGSSLVVRVAVRVGAALGKWQRRRHAARDDAFVEQWKAAWQEGCAAYQAGVPEDRVPYRRSPRKDAWLAGRGWAERQQR